jgi:hypothetical protein
LSRFFATTTSWSALSAARLLIVLHVVPRASTGLNSGVYAGISCLGLTDWSRAMLFGASVKAKKREP